MDLTKEGGVAMGKIGGGDHTQGIDAAGAARFPAEAKVSKPDTVSIQGFSVARSTEGLTQVSIPGPSKEILGADTKAMVDSARNDKAEVNWDRKADDLANKAEYAQEATAKAAAKMETKRNKDLEEKKLAAQDLLNKDQVNADLAKKKPPGANLT